MKSLKLGRTNTSQTLRLSDNEDRRAADQAVSFGSPSSHPPLISVFTGRGGNARSDQEDRATIEKHPTDKEKA